MMSIVLVLVSLLLSRADFTHCPALFMVEFEIVNVSWDAIYSHDLHFPKYAIQQATTSAKQHVFFTSSKLIKVFILCIHKADTKHN